MYLWPLNSSIKTLWRIYILGVKVVKCILYNGHIFIYRYWSATGCTSFLETTRLRRAFSLVKIDDETATRQDKFEDTKEVIRTLEAKDNIMAKWKWTKRQVMVRKTLHNKTKEWAKRTLLKREENSDQDMYCIQSINLRACIIPLLMPFFFLFFPPSFNKDMTWLTQEEVIFDSPKLVELWSSEFSVSFPSKLTHTLACVLLFTMCGHLRKHAGFRIWLILTQCIFVLSLLLILVTHLIPSNCSCIKPLSL